MDQPIDYSWDWNFGSVGSARGRTSPIPPDTSTHITDDSGNKITDDSGDSLITG